MSKPPAMAIAGGLNWFVAFAFGTSTTVESYSRSPSLPRKATAQNAKSVDNRGAGASPRAGDTMTTRLSYMPFYFGDYLADTQHLNAPEHGAYFLLIGAAFMRESPLPVSRLALLAKMTDAEWKAVEPTLREFFIVENGTWRHSRVEREIAKARAKSAKAKASANHRHSSGNANDEDQAYALRPQCERTADAELSRSGRSATQTHTHTQHHNQQTVPLPLEQEAAREETKVFDFSRVGVGTACREISKEARIKVATTLSIEDAAPIVRAYQKWLPTKKGKPVQNIEVHFVASAKRIFGNLSDDERKACGPLVENSAVVAPPPIDMVARDRVMNSDAWKARDRAALRGRH